MKLYDIAPRQVMSPDGGQDLKIAGRTVVDINNIARYWREHINNQSGMLTTEDTPNPVCPWPNAWFEFAWKSAFKPQPDAPDGLQLAFTVDAVEEPDRFKFIAHQFTYYPDPKYAEVFPGGNQWLFIAQHLWQTTRDGVFAGYDNVGGKAYKSMLRNQAGLTEEEIEDALSREMHILWLALSFLNCKNVTTVNNSTPTKVAKKRRKQGRPVGVTYKTLVIDGMKQVLRTEGGIEKNGLKKALHICRGHFATYTPDKPLFGHFTGTIWKPMHVRGNKKQGEVKKDYKVVAGE